VNPSDLFRFLLAFGLLPVIIRLGRGIRMPAGRLSFVLGVAAITVAFGMQAFGPIIPWSGLRLLRHFVFGFGGFALAWAAWQARGSELASSVGDRR
jgi:hypothetical protein